MELPVQHNGKKYLFGNQSPLLPVFLLHHKAPGAFGDPRWLPVPLASFPGERRGEGARWDCGARAWGMELLLLLLPLRSLALDGVPAAFLPLTVKPSEAERLMSARFKESFSILILFFSWCTYWFMDNAASPFHCVTVSNTSICLYCWVLFL